MSTKIVYTVGFTDLLCLLFVCLKLTGVIDWSWWWVTSPFWIPISMFGVWLLFIALLKLIAIIIAMNVLRQRL